MLIVSSSFSPGPCFFCFWKGHEYSRGTQTTQSSGLGSCSCLQCCCTRRSLSKSYGPRSWRGYGPTPFNSGMSSILWFIDSFSSPWFRLKKKFLGGQIRKIRQGGYSYIWRRRNYWKVSDIVKLPRPFPSRLGHLAYRNWAENSMGKRPFWTSRAHG